MAFIAKSYSSSILKCPMSSKRKIFASLLNKFSYKKRLLIGNVFIIVASIKYASNSSLIELFIKKDLRDDFELGVYSIIKSSLKKLVLKNFKVLVAK